MQWFVLVVVLIVVATTSGSAADIKAAITPDLRILQVRGVAESAGFDIAVRLQSAPAAAPAMMGSMVAENGLTEFTPIVPFLAGEAYRVEIDGPKQERISIQVTAPKNAAEAPVVTMQPRGAVFPANALKFYLHFSEPMEQGVFLDRLRLFQQDGKEVVGPFRETELWSPDGRRLTVWFHPGRQKTGVNLNEEEGPVLRPGTSYELVVSSSWRSVNGISIGKDQRFAFQAGPPDHERPNPGSWVIRAPRAGSDEPLRLDLRESLDPALLRNGIEVRRSDGNAADGAAVATVAEDGSGIDFHGHRWEAGEYEIGIKPGLEDLAGNNLVRPFEVDLSTAPSSGSPRPTILRFAIKP